MDVAFTILRAVVAAMLIRIAELLVGRLRRRFLQIHGHTNQRVDASVTPLASERVLSAAMTELSRQEI
jgi:hypothetical protein